MDISVTLRHGPLDVEITADSDEDYKQELLDLADFLEENEERFDGLQVRQTSEEGNGEGKGSQASLSEEWDSNQSDSNAGGAVSTDGPLGPVAEDLQIDVGRLEEIIHVDEQAESPPFLLLDDPDVLGDLKVERQRSASVILLYLWKKCYDLEKVPSSDLKQALEDSDISSTNMFHMYDDEGKRYFNQKGQGPSASVKLRGPGERQAREEIKQLVSDL